MRKINIAEPFIEDEEIAAVIQALKEKRLSQGEYVEKFENSFTEYVGTNHAIAFNSGTAALQVGLAAKSIKSKDEIITSPFTFAATANVIALLRATPVFVDVDPETLNINPSFIEEAITPNTKAIIPVHYAGQCAEMDDIKRIAKDHDLFVLEDAAEAHGSLYKEKLAGNLGDAGTFSFYPNKNIVTGEGGMLTTNDDELATKARILRNHGQDRRYHHVEIGWNYKMMDLVAAIGLVQMKRINHIIKRKKEIAEYYIKGFNKFDFIRPQTVRSYNLHTYMLFPVLTHNQPQRDALQSILEKAGVETRIAFPSLHLQPVFQRLYGFTDGQFPVAEKASKTVLCLPIHAYLQREDQDYIMNIIQESQKEIEELE
ncbi:MAG: DegT/DnrJ/EryC1/StrS family aminotransferase [Promethearchaeota archaeon]